jgi:hypothetical protein
MKIILKGWGFDVGQDFARAIATTPFLPSPAEYSGGQRWVIGYIPADPAAKLGFLRNGSSGRIRVRVDLQALGDAEGDFPPPLPLIGERLLAADEVPEPTDHVYISPREGWHQCGRRFSGLPVGTLRNRTEIAEMHFCRLAPRS